MKVVGLDGKEVVAKTRKSIKEHIAIASERLVEVCEDMEVLNVTLVVETNGYAPLTTVSAGHNVLGTVGALEYAKSCIVKAYQDG